MHACMHAAMLNKFSAKCKMIAKCMNATLHMQHVCIKCVPWTQCAQNKNRLHNYTQCGCTLHSINAYLQVNNYVSVLHSYYI